MKFNFCGDLDCPDWLLLEISNLSKLSAVKVKLLTAHCIKCFIEDDGLDQCRVQQQSSSSGIDETKSVSAALHFIITSAAKFDTAPERLDEELQQLGLPREHSGQISRGYDEQLTLLSEALCRRIPRNNRLKFEPTWQLVSTGSIDPDDAWTRVGLDDPEKISTSPFVTLNLDYSGPELGKKTVRLPVSMTLLDLTYLRVEVGRVLTKMNQLAEL